MAETRDGRPQLILITNIETQSVVVEMEDGYTLEELTTWIKECRVWEAEGYYMRTIESTNPNTESVRVAKVINRHWSGSLEVTRPT